jgi:hypothetical protein
MIRDVVKNHRVSTGPMGHIRYRAAFSDGRGDVAVFSGAHQVA